jgi:acyl-coenzyme A synthetase/AMP-(fatty) acid ligase
VKAPALAEDVGAEPWIIVQSSGTTGTPKSIPHTHDRALLYSCVPQVQSDAANLDRMLVFASPHLAMSMNAILCQLVNGNTLVLASNREPQNFFEIVERDRPTHLLTSTGTAVRLVAYAAQSLPDSRRRCESLQGISIAGSPASSSLCFQIAQYIGPDLEITYGSSEAGRVAKATAETLALHPQSAGRLHEWVDVEVVDDEGRVVPAGESGVLRVKTPYLVTGYLGDPETSEKAFRDGWYYPGDTGSVDAAGYLTLTGRVDELLNLGGNKIDPFTIEAVLDSQPGIEESAVLSVPTPGGAAILVAMVVASRPWDEAAIKQACTERLGRHRTPARILAAKSIPRNAGGKVMRKEAAEMLAKQLEDAEGPSTVH